MLMHTTLHRAKKSDKKQMKMRKTEKPFNRTFFCQQDKKRIHKGFSPVRRQGYRGPALQLAPGTRWPSDLGRSPHGSDPATTKPTDAEYYATHNSKQTHQNVEKSP